MAGSQDPLAAPGNRLLSHLPKQELLLLRPHLEQVTLQFQTVLYDLHQPITHVYFPLRGVMSAVTSMLDGGYIEVATIGNEGLVGLTAMLEDQGAPNRLVVQVEMDAYRLTAEAFRARVNVPGAFRRVIGLYSTAYAYQVSQAVACNGLHFVQQRCCRWILMTHDRALANEFPLTHEFLSHMLGVRRVSVTAVLKPLQEAGLIENRRGRITVLNRSGLEAECCECYQAVQSQFDRLFPRGPA
jgi:CRP-like cAMP-binding protein